LGVATNDERYLVIHGDLFEVVIRYSWGISGSRCRR
jgi:hypothetical protein